MFLCICCWNAPRLQGILNTTLKVFMKTPSVHAHGIRPSLQSPRGCTSLQPSFHYSWCWKCCKFFASKSAEANCAVLPLRIFRVNYANEFERKKRNVLKICSCGPQRFCSNICNNIMLLPFVCKCWLSNCSPQGNLQQIQSVSVDFMLIFPNTCGWDFLKSHSLCCYANTLPRVKYP